MNHIEKYHEVAALLGATFIPVHFPGSENGPFKDRGWFVFGDATDWRTLKLFIYPDRYGKYVAKHEIELYQFDTSNIARKNDAWKLPICTNEIKISVDRGADAIAKDIKRRLLDKVVVERPKAVAYVEDFMSKANEQRAWKESMGLEPGRDYGEVWRGVGMSQAIIDEVSSTGATLKLRYLTREQAEAVLSLLKTTPHFQRKTK